jgi:NADH-quinone oxidoreductase subunit D
MEQKKVEEMLINMGPQHPSTHGVFRVLIESDGETVARTESHIGYLHRCFEKIAENMTYLQIHPYTDRLDYLAAMLMNFGYAVAIEKLLDIQVPERASYIRVIVAELQRVASHLVAVGTYGLDVGAITPFLYTFRDREKVLKFFERVCGQRLNYNYIRIGGVAYDMPQEMAADISDFVVYMRPKIKELNDLLTYNGIFIRRTANIGVIPPEMAVQYGCSGPVLRGSGVKRDLRRDTPYSIYNRFDFDIPVGKGEVGHVGDCWDRYIVRMREMEESLKIVEQAVKSLPAGDYIDAKAKKPLRPKGEVYHAVESARGELGFHVIANGKNVPYRLKVRSPSFSNICILDAISPGHLLADLVAIIGSLDIVMGEVDR